MIMGSRQRLSVQCDDLEIRIDDQIIKRVDHTKSRWAHGRSKDAAVCIAKNGLDFLFPWGVHMRAIFGFKFHANLCKLPQFLASIKQRFFHMEEAEKLTFQTIPNLPWFIPKFVRNRCFREWLHLCRVENQSSESSFTSKGCLPKPFEISFCGTYLKVGIEEQSCDFFS